MNHLPRGVLWVVVLGDFGRSPRMQYHTLSLLNEYYVNVHVFAQSNDLQGFIPELLESKAAGRLHLWRIIEIPALFKQLPTKLIWLLKLILYFCTMLGLMIAATVRAGRPNLMLIQSPPANPTLAVSALIRYLYGTATIIDFHNIAYTLMRSSPAPGKDKSLLYADDPLAVQLAGKQEKYFARFCDSALTVSQRFQHWLRNRWKVQAHVLYDKAPSFFQPASPEDAHELFQAIKPKLLDSFPPAAQFVHDAYSTTTTPVTTVGRNGKLAWRSRPRPFVVISSTSWTPDEDFGILLEACIEYDSAVVDCRKAAAAAVLPPMLVIITGRGPQQEMYREKISELNLTNVSFHMAWLEPRHYSVALATADVGVSLHTSSSELDLPMKVSDMLGCGLPVCAMDYPTAREQVVPGHTGRLFKTSSELAAIFRDLLAPEMASAHPRGCGRQLAEMGKNVVDQREQWHTHWKLVVPPIIDGIAPKLRHN